jgi:hypothetical protein
MSAFLRVDIDALAKQQPDNLCFATIRRSLEGIAVLTSLCVDVSASVEQQLDDLYVTAV